MKKLGLSALFAILLSACASTPAPVVEQPASAPVEAQVDAPADTGNTQVEPVQEPEPVAVNPLTDPNNILSQRHVFFDFDSYTVKEDFNGLVQAHAQYLLANQDAKVILQGNADERGTAEYNMALGQKRAEAVRSMLRALGVADEQIEAVSFGEEKPLAEGSGEESWAQNRRADIVYRGE